VVELEVRFVAAEKGKIGVQWKNEEKGKIVISVLLWRWSKKIWRCRKN